MKKARAEKPVAKVLRPLNPEECRRIQGGLAFPFIQQAMDDSPDSGG